MASAKQLPDSPTNVYVIQRRASGGGGATPPATLSAATPSGTLGTSTTATPGATSNQTTGTLFGIIDSAANIVGITGPQIKAGQNKNSSAAVGSSSGAVANTTPSLSITGLTAATAYSFALIQNNANGDSNIVTGTFTTASSSLVFSDTFSDRATGAVSTGSANWSSKNYELDSDTLSDVVVQDRSTLPAALLSDANVPAGKTRFVRFRQGASEATSMVLWHAPVTTYSTLWISWWEARTNNNSGNEKFSRVGSFDISTGNRFIDAVIGREQKDNASLISFANSALMNQYVDGGYVQTNDSYATPHFDHYERGLILSTGANSDGSDELWINGTRVLNYTGLQDFKTTGDAAAQRYLDIVQHGGWNSGLVNLLSGGATTYPIDRYFGEVRHATTRQGVWAMANV